MNRLDKIRRKLDQLSNYDVEECARLDLGISKHGFRIEPPLSEAEAAVFEEQWGILLPQDYRVFITTVGSSGAGPYYGLLPLAQATDHLNCDNEEMYKKALGAAFPLSNKAYQEGWLVEVGGVNWKEERYTAEPWNPYQGSMAICDQGCTFYTTIALTGPLRGTIWNIDLALSPPVQALYPNFLDYYEGWIDRILAKETLFWYGYTGNKAPRNQLFRDDAEY
jgi:hypothetical protein